jgi:hypothetical protein
MSRVPVGRPGLPVLNRGTATEGAPLAPVLTAQISLASPLRIETRCYERRRPVMVYQEQECLVVDSL